VQVGEPGCERCIPESGWYYDRCEPNAEGEGGAPVYAQRFCSGIVVCDPEDSSLVCEASPVPALPGGAPLEAEECCGTNRCATIWEIRWDCDTDMWGSPEKVGETSCEVCEESSPWEYDRCEPNEAGDGGIPIYSCRVCGVECDSAGDGSECTEGEPPEGVPDADPEELEDCCNACVMGDCAFPEEEAETGTYSLNSREDFVGGAYESSESMATGTLDRVSCGVWEGQVESTFTAYDIDGNLTPPEHIGRPQNQHTTNLTVSVSYLGDGRWTVTGLGFLIDPSHSTDPDEANQNGGITNVTTTSCSGFNRSEVEESNGVHVRSDSVDFSING